MTKGQAMSESTAGHAPRTYGHWTRPALKGVVGLSLGVTLALFLAALAVIVAVVIGGWKAALTVVALTAVALLPLLRNPRTGRSFYRRWQMAIASRLGGRRGGSVLVQGPAGLVPDGRCRLPGLLAASELYEAQDAYGTPFGLIRVPATGTYSVVIEASATGTQAVDQWVVDQQVARWGSWLASLGQEYTDVIGAQVTIETAPDSGVRLRRAIDARRSPAAPPFAAAVMDQVKDYYPAGQAETSCLISVSFSSSHRGGGGKETRVPLDDMATRISNVLPSLVAGLRQTGAGNAPVPMSAQDLIDYTRIAYDPTVAQLVEEARATPEGTGLEWNEVGPTFLDDRNPHQLVHDRAHSVSWQMLEAPRGIVQAGVLQTLLAPHPEITRKRVTLLYRPLSVEQSVAVAEAEVMNAEFEVNNAKRVRARQRVRLRNAQQMAAEEASGAGLVRFGVIVTASVTDAAQLPRARETVKNLSLSARLRLREATHTQASTFAAGLPLGLVLPRQVLLPPEITEAI